MSLILRVSFSRLSSGASEPDESRQEADLQSNGCQEALGRSVAPRGTERVLTAPSCGAGALLRAVESRDQCLAAPTTEPSHNSSRSTAEVGAEWDQRQVPDNSNSLKIQPGSSKIEDEGRKITDQQKKNRNSIKERGGGLLLPSRSRRIFDKIWLGKGQGENSKSSETSGSSQSPPPSAKPRDGKSSGASSRNRRHSVS
uniref:Uncharacterized protein n=1 Tax=Ananas comosus var. bracteatus TaxID=296719 RepID=A0A6V7P467_ANACO|nr:unnamed protein product [Ananas comosus var. bracteatus]